MAKYFLENTKPQMKKLNFKVKLVDTRLKKECGLRLISLRRNDDSVEFRRLTVVYYVVCKGNGGKSKRIQLQHSCSMVEVQLQKKCSSSHPKGHLGHF
jgi:hypothetical protein